MIEYFKIEVAEYVLLKLCYVNVRTLLFLLNKKNNEIIIKFLPKQKSSWNNILSTTWYFKFSESCFQYIFQPSHWFNDGMNNSFKGKY